MRRPLLRLVIAAPGGLGSPSVPTMRDCLQWLDAVRTNGGETCRDKGGCSPPIRARKHGPEAQNRRQWSAVRRAHRSQGVRRASSAYRWRKLRPLVCAAWKSKDAPCGAPLPHFGEGNKKTGAPGAGKRIRAMALDQHSKAKIKGQRTDENARAATVSAHPRASGDPDMCSAGFPLSRE